ncbi:MAG: type II toxin-antitoxin system RatA family toxin [Actinomycetota bacterium]
MIRGGWSIDFPRLDAARLFALAVDIESYPQFLPWCRSARVRRRDGGVLDVDNHFGAGPLDVRFCSRAVAEEPTRLEITSEDGPFRRFRLVWLFEPQADGGCRVLADYELSLRSPLLQSLARLSMPELERKVARRFRDRARMLYG